MSLLGIVGSTSSSAAVVRPGDVPRRDRGWFAGVVVGSLLVGLLVFAGSARAAFPGQNGLLAVQPLSGSGILLIEANGLGVRRVCAQPADLCGVTSPGRLLRPQWSPDGGALVLGRTGDYPYEDFELVYPDGSCLDCLALGLGESGDWTDAAFTSNATLLTAVTATTVSPGGVTRDALVEYGVDALERKVVLTGSVSDPVWSSRGELALVRGAWIWVGSPGTLRRVTRGSAVSWSPDGKQIVFVRSGWLRDGAARGHSFRRMVRGAAPAWSPDGGWIAFFDTHHRLSLIHATGGKVRRLGGVIGSTVDWQPLPAAAPPPCSAPPGATVVASSDAAMLTATNANSSYYPFPPGSAVMGCLRADGRERLISSSTAPPYYSVGFGPTQMALDPDAPYAAFAGTADNTHDQYMVSSVNVYDLRTGLVIPHAGGQVATCSSAPPCTSTVDQLVVGGDIVTAVHTTVHDASRCPPPSGPSCGSTVEQIVATDSTGVNTLDSVSEPDGSPPQLTNLALTGVTLTWEDNGAPHSAQLQP